uniref:Solute carrier family 35 member F1 n=1 Tax=Haemonchus placei TaxID=6290 RepID=A0A0N4X6M5_HAEPC
LISIARNTSFPFPPNSIFKDLTNLLIDFHFSRTFRSIALGQVLSLCLCGTGISSQLLSNRGVNAPAAQSFTNYFLLCFVYCTALSCKTGDEGLLGVMRRRGLQYFVLALIDVEANYMIVYAYQFTNLTSVQLLDCSTIPMVLLLSWLFLSVRYLISHIIGVCICLVGIACLIWADILDGKGSIGGDSKLILSSKCIPGSLLWGLRNRNKNKN